MLHGGPQSLNVLVGSLGADVVADLIDRHMVEVCLSRAEWRTDNRIGPVRQYGADGWFEPWKEPQWIGSVGLEIVAAYERRTDRRLDFRLKVEHRPIDYPAAGAPTPNGLAQSPIPIST